MSGNPVNTKEAAKILGVSASFLHKARVVGDGPVFTKLGHAVRYDIEDLAAYKAARKRRSTSEGRAH